MQHHSAREIVKGANAGKWAYVGGNDRDGHYVECCHEAFLSGGWENPAIGHATREEAYAHMRQVLLGRLRLDGKVADWSGCRAPKDGGRCDVPTKDYADIPPMHFGEPLCDEHRTREVVEAMWDGPGDSFGSW